LKNINFREIKRWVSAVVTMLLLALFFLNPFWLLEYRLQDALYQHPGLVDINTITVIGIDERALAKFGQFPWDRNVMAEALNILNRYEDAKPAVIAIDVLFLEPGRDSEADVALVDAVIKGDNVILASLIESGVPRHYHTLDMTFSGHLMSFPDLRPYGTHGFVNGFLARDGVIRNAPLRIPFDGEMLYSFPLTIAMKYTGLEPYDLVNMPSDGYFYTYISYTGLPGDFFEFSVADIFEDWFDPTWLADMVVMIGPYALGMMDSYAVPITHEVPMYGVEIHANVVQMILEGNFRQYTAGWVNHLIVVALLIGSMFFGEKFSIRYAWMIFVIAGLGYFVCAYLMYQFGGYIMPLLSPFLAVFIVFLYQLVYGYALGVIERIRVRNVFQKYVDPKLVDKLIATKDADSDAVGRKLPIAVLFVDVRGFTPMTEALSDTPELVVETLNGYLELTTTAIFNNGGSVDKFIGDATMALFNGFVPLDDYVYKAVKSAWDMVCGAQAVSAAIKEKIGVDLEFGVGVHCGEAIVGNLGPSFRKDYTAIGDVVNTAARLESNAARSQILISQDVYDVVKGRVHVESIGEISLKGKSKPMEIFSVTGLK